MPFTTAGAAYAIYNKMNQDGKNKMNTSSWIKMSERNPTEADLPIIYGGYFPNATAWERSPDGWVQVDCTNQLHLAHNWTHWFPIGKIPAPPKEEHSGLMSLYLQKHPRPHNTEMFAHQRGWEDGVRDERSAVRSIIDNYEATNKCTLVGLAAEIKRRIES